MKIFPENPSAPLTAFYHPDKFTIHGLFIAHNLPNFYYLFIGIAFLFFAFLDFMHLLGNKNMGVFPQYGNLGLTFHTASRYVLGISLALAPLFIKRKLNTTVTFATYSLVTILVILSIFYWRNFPVTYIEGVGLTPFKLISDYAICFVLLGAIGLLLINRRALMGRFTNGPMYNMVAWTTTIVLVALTVTMVVTSFLPHAS